MLNKKILSLILAFCLIVCNTSHGHALELDDACPGEMSSDSHIGCSFMKGKELLTKGNDYVGIKNVGKDSKYSFYFFSYRAINEILDKFKPCSKKEMEEKFPMKMERVLVEPSGALKALSYGAAKLAGCTVGVGMVILANLLGFLNFFPNVDRHIEVFPVMKAFFNRIPNAIGGFPANKLMLLLGGLWGCTAATSDLKSHYECVYSENFSENLAARKKIENNNTIILSALNSLEEGISDKDYQIGENDFIFLRLTHSKDYPIGYAEFNKAGVKYSDEEKASFGQRFEELSGNLTKILENKKEYGVY